MKFKLPVGAAFGLFVGFGLIGSVFGQTKPLVRGPPPPLPPHSIPLLPPVPSKEWVDRLTKAQLAFIRHHQEVQKHDQIPYSPFACLPKYICIVDDLDGTKRTAVVNGLHPVLRGVEIPKFDRPYLPTVKPLSKNARSDHILHTDPKYQERLDRDEFLMEQERYDQMALEQQRRKVWEMRERQRINAASESEEDESVESLEQSHGQGGPKPTPLANANANANPNGTYHPGNHNKKRVRVMIKMPKIFQRSPKSGQVVQPSNPNSKPSFFNKILLRGKRNIPNKMEPFLTKLGPGIKSSDQCRVLYNGCDLSYEQIMQIADEGNVLIEGDDPVPKGQKNTKNKPKKPPRPVEDDELEALKRNPALAPKIKKKKPFIPEYKIKKPPPKYGDIKSPHNSKGTNKKPVPEDEKSEEQEDERDQNKIPFGSLPILPMRFQWGKPQIYINGRPQSPDLFGVNSRRPTKQPTPPPTTTSTTPPPIFVGKPVYQKRPNGTVVETSILKINATHALEIKSPKTKPYRPNHAKLVDKNGNPSSFASVFTEIAGSSGGIHDYFDKIAKAVAGDEDRNKVAPTIGPFPAKKKDKKKKKEEEGSSEQVQDEESEEDEGKGRAGKIKKYKISKKKNKKKGQVSKAKEEEEEEVEDKEHDKPEEEEEEQEDQKNKDTQPHSNLKSKPTQTKLKPDKLKDVPEPEDEEEDDEPQDEESQEGDKRIKAAMSLKLPSKLPLYVQQAIRQDIINGGNGNINIKPGIPQPQAHPYAHKKKAPSPPPPPPPQPQLAQYYYGPGSGSGNYLSLFGRPIATL